MHYTNIEQSKKLLELGLNPESADMCYYEHIAYIDGTPKVGYKEGVTDGIPCWSVGALRILLPLGIKKNDQTYLFSNHNREDGSFVYLYGIDNNVYIQSTGSDINACYEMMCWLLENNYIEKDGKD